jgi:hypothetical protein
LLQSQIERRDFCADCAHPSTVPPPGPPSRSQQDRTPEGGKQRRLNPQNPVLIRLGYAGKVVSPHKGWASTSDVADFSEEHNDFTPADSNAPDPWAE